MKDESIENLEQNEVKLLRNPSLVKEQPDKKQNISLHDGNAFKCNKCDLSFASAKSALFHAKFKHDSVQYPCSHCNYRATNTTNLNRHVKGVHTDLIYTCPAQQCEYRTGYSSNLEKHKRSKHLETVEAVTGNDGDYYNV